MKRQEIPLTWLKEGEVGIVSSIRRGRGRMRGHGWGFEKRLMDMGFTPGTEVLVVRSAPFHGPLEVLVRGTRLALGRGLAEKIFVVKKENG
ncbi:ferrous iron transport protein A [Candidatus Bathyarchaeota archaeon]|nr:ferrous iron transport protein A [Candidatus Bathyarchaeota archaeon]